MRFVLVALQVRSCLPKRVVYTRFALCDSSWSHCRFALGDAHGDAHGKAHGDAPAGTGQRWMCPDSVAAARQGGLRLGRRPEMGLLAEMAEKGVQQSVC